MKICWDMLEGVYLMENGFFKKGNDPYVYKESCKWCGESYLTAKRKSSSFCSRSCALSGDSHPLYGKSPTIEARKKMSLAAKRRFADNNNNPNYKGGVEKLCIPLFDTFAPKLDYVEGVRLIIKDGFRRLGVKCAYCGGWFTPTLFAVRSRLAALKQDPKGRTYGECRFYCSENCKQACPTYGRKLYPRGFKHTTSREVNPYLRQMVFERDNWECQICGKTSKEAQLHCHHMDPVAQYPMLQNDMDSCITLCKGCHKMVHSRKGCRYVDLRCRGKTITQFTVKGYGVS